MRRSTNRKSTPKVKDGRVQRKDRHELTPNYWNTTQSNVVIDQEKPGKGFKHFLKKRDVALFLSLIPNWAVLSEGLDAILLARGEDDLDGFYDGAGVVGICAWEVEQDVEMDISYFDAHRETLERLGIQHKIVKNAVLCEFSVEQIKAFQLLHILLHELGHHFDRMQTKSKRRSARGEQFAEDYAFEFEEKMWSAYQEAFDVVF